MNRTRQKWYIITIVILSIVVLALVGFFVIKPAIENWRVDKVELPESSRQIPKPPLLHVLFAKVELTEDQR